MVEPDNIMLEHLRAIRAKLEEHDKRFDVLEQRLSDRIEGLELKLDGLAHVTLAGFGSVVHELEAIKERVTRLETEPA